MTTSIYGLFDSAGVCVYVGRTANPHSRQMAHGDRFLFRVLKRVRKRANIIEGQFIRRYKSIGQASLNNHTNRSNRSLTTLEAIQLVLDVEKSETRQFTVNSIGDRNLVLGVARTLRDAGQIDFTISTKKIGKSFVVFAPQQNATKCKINC